MFFWAGTSRKSQSNSRNNHISAVSIQLVRAGGDQVDQAVWSGRAWRPQISLQHEPSWGSPNIQLCPGFGWAPGFSGYAVRIPAVGHRASSRNGEAWAFHSILFDKRCAIHFGGTLDLGSLLHVSGRPSPIWRPRYPCESHPPPASCITNTTGQIIPSSKVEELRVQANANDSGAKYLFQH